MGKVESIKSGITFGETIKYIPDALIKAPSSYYDES